MQCIKRLHFKTADKPDEMCEIGDVEQDIVSNVLVEHLRIVHLALERELANLLQYTAFYKFVQVGMGVDFVFLADVNMSKEDRCDGFTKQTVDQPELAQLPRAPELKVSA